ncbi:hypothetical protein ACQ1PL_03435 [Ornithobacterium rhinotracheale]
MRQRIRLRKFTSLLSLSLILFTLIAKGQEIKGSIKNTEKELIPLATILIKENNQIKEFFTVKNGNYIINLKRSYKDSISVEVKAGGYDPKEKHILLSQKDKVTLDFILTKTNLVKLKELIVNAKEKSIEMKKDTIVYNVSSFKNDFDRKVEDVIKKLPGFTVDKKTGEIKFKNKSISALLIEGDDLFGYSYMLGTRNINIDIVDKIEAIENYSKNPLLKNIKNTDDVALNLKLKKGKIDFSGTADTSLGYAEEKSVSKNLSATNIVINKKFKAMGLLSYNNVGRDETPFDYFSNRTSLEDSKENKRIAKIIPEESLKAPLDEEKVNINNQFFVNYNSIYKFNKRVKINNNFYFLKDELSSFRSIESNYNLDNIHLSTFDKNQITKKPLMFRGDLNLTYNTSQTSLLEYSLKGQKQFVKSNNSILNNVGQFESLLDSKEFYIFQKILYTKKLSSSKALQLKIDYNVNSTNQTLAINTGLLNDSIFGKKQQVSLNQNLLNGEILLHGATSLGSYSLIAGFKNEKKPLNSNYYNENNELDFSNDLNYQALSIYNKGVLKRKIKKVGINLNYVLRVLNQNLEDKENKNIIFEPSVNLSYKLNQKSRIFLNLGYSEKNNLQNHFFSEEILISNRELLKNTPSFNLSKIYYSGLYYRYYDLINEMNIIGSVNFELMNGAYFPDVSINEKMTRYNYFFMPENTKSSSLNFHFSKFIKNIKTKIELDANFKEYNYKNVVNNSNLKDVLNSVYGGEFFIKKTLGNIASIQNKIEFNYSQFSSGTNSTHNKQLNNTLSLYFYPNKKWNTSIDFNNYYPDMDRYKNNYIFIDLLTRYVIRKNLEITAVYRNLFNEKVYQTISNTDYSNTTYKVNILPRNFLINLTFSF